MGLQAGAYSLQADGATAAAVEPEVCRRECQRWAAGRAAALEVYIDTASGMWRLVSLIFSNIHMTPLIEH